MWKKIPLKGFVYASAGINLALFILIALIRDFLPPVVPLFYGLPSGESQLAPSLALFIVPGGSLIINAVNILISGVSKDAFFAKSMVISGFLVSFLGAVTVIKIIFLVGFF